MSSRNEITVIDLGPKHEEIFHLCLEDWSAELREAGPHKAHWCSRYRERGLRVKLALDDRGEVGGMIQYLPIEESFAAGHDLYMILCIWVHGYKQGRGDFRKHGMGEALLAAAEADARERGAKGIAAWGLGLPFWMRASWFKKHGYRKADRDGLRVLVWKSFADDAAPPKWIRERKRPGAVPGKVNVVSFRNGWCPAQNLAYERAQRACAALGDKVRFEVIDTSERAVMLEWGICDALFVDGKPIWLGPPPSFEKIQKTIARRIGKLQP